MEKSKGSRLGYFLSSLVGLILGALLVLFFLPTASEQTVTESAVRETPAVQETASQPAQTAALPQSEVMDVSSVVEQVGGSVVGITNIQMQRENGVFGIPQSTQEVPAGTGSGVIYKKEGDLAYIVTNNHVVAGANQLEITLDDGTNVEGKMVGTDVWTDLAVITMDASAAETVVDFGDSSALKAGQPVIAIGNPLGLEFAGSVTTGVVSGVERIVPVDVDGDGRPDFQSEAIQTDAAINPGNSGGALLDTSGKLIGINSMKISTETVEGIGLAIPISYAMPIIEQLEQNGEVHRATIGATLIDLSAIRSVYRADLGLPESVESGVIVQRVLRDSAASRAGLQAVDVITSADGQTIESTQQLRQYLFTEKKVGDELQLQIYRNGNPMQMTLSLTDNLQI
ncbi:S1C family serine protease [Saccharibacillus sp. JS10]|uniref:S1C family serine protease n=1 Tax=Saccharibacillus sp. JS10 TaxID=2950552 RepID=UPI00210E0903|nr:trypsin-like peptidase domain-containing protein [Saccharibacillus sp. JS10]MCQ4085377.1 trypsin-like peptidase domain-containing protein [Saccharibacillus sp. JS10]